MKCLSVLAALIVACGAPFPAPAEPLTTGEWVTADGEALLDLTTKENSLSVELRSIAQALLRSDETPRDVDRNNPNPALRDRPLSGLLLGDLVREPRNSVWRGRLYDPSRGKTYRVVVQQMTDDVLGVRAYVGVRALGRTMLWVRRAHFETRLREMLATGAET